MALQVGDTNERGEQVVAVVDDIPVTAEAKAQVRAKLAAAGKRMTPAKWAALREQFGIRPRTS